MKDSDATLVCNNSKLGQNPCNIRNEPGISLVTSTTPLFQDPSPPMSKDDNIEQAVDTRSE